MSSTPDADPDWLRRPEEQFRDLPLAVRWELTRRHPTYLLAWRHALQHFRGGPFEGPGDADLCRAACLLLGGIGVAGEPVDPATSADRLLEGIGPEWLGGPVRPISVRAMAILLYTLLPQEERRAVGETFVCSASPEHAIDGDDGQRGRQIVRGLEELQTLPFPSIDRFPDKPLYYVQMDASQTSILDDMTLNVRRYHARGERPDRRTRIDSVEDGLAVWDLREGWTGSGYDAGRETTLDRIATELGVPVTTVASRYRVAFRLVTGLDFTAERWLRLMGPLKLLGPDRALGRQAAAVARQLSGRSARPIPESALRSGRPEEGERPGLVTGGTAVAHGFDLVDLLMDVESLARGGLSDEEIAGRLEVPTELIAAVRGRLDELRHV